jgi:multidrug efflux pump subunit AcrB
LLIAAALLGGCGAAGGVVAWRAAEVRRHAETPRVVAVVAARGLNAADADGAIAPVLERAARQVTGTQRMQVVSREGESRLDLALAPRTDPDQAVQALMNALTPLLPSLPSAASPPYVVRAPSDLGVRFTIDGDRHPLLELEALLESKVVPAIERIAGVAAVTTCGLRPAAVVRVDPDRAAGMGVSVSQVVDALSSPSFGSTLPDPGAIRDTVLPATSPVPVRVRDVAVVAVEGRDAGCIAFAHAGPRPSATVRLRQGADVADTTARVREALARGVGLPPDVKLVALDGDVLRARLQLPAGATRELQARWATALGAELEGIADVAGFVIEVGPAGGAAPSDATAYVALVERARRASPDPHATALAIGQAVAQRLPDATVLVDTEPGAPVTGVERPARVRVLGDDLDAMRAASRDVRDALSSVPGVEGLLEEGRPASDLEVRPDRAALARYGLNTGDVSRTVQALLGGIVASRVVQPGGEPIDVVVRVGLPGARDTVELLTSTRVRGPAGTIPLSQIASVTARLVPASIAREDGRRRIAIVVGLGRDRGRTLGAAEQAVAARAKLPAGLAIAWDEEEPP